MFLFMAEVVLKSVIMKTRTKFIINDDFMIIDALLLAGVEFG